MWFTYLYTGVSLLDIFDQLWQSDDIARGFEAMAVERRNWLTKPAHLVRAARHYEGAAQILIRQAVMSARQVLHIFVTVQ